MIAQSDKQVELTILMPCLNEAETLASCIIKANAFLEEHNVSGEVLIADNGSTDGSQQIAREHGARVVDVQQRGYGAALIGGCDAARGEYVIMGDADCSYDFSDLMPFVERLREGFDLVMGNRFKGGIAKGAMPPLHRYFGNPGLSWLGRLFFKSPVGDFYCGLRGYNAARIRELELRALGMEYAIEMIVQATMNGYKIAEVPTTLSPDGRSRPPHLRTWNDGWRTLKFLLMHSPNWLFLYPGIILAIIGLILGTAVEISSINLFEATLDVNTLLYSAAMVITGFNLVSFHAFTKIYAMHAKFIRVGNSFLARINAEPCIICGIILTIIGIAMTILAFITWGRESFGEMVLETFMRITIPAVAFIVVGIQLIFSGFFIEIMRIKIKGGNDADNTSGVKTRS